MDSSGWLSALALFLAVGLLAESVRQLRRRWLLVKVEGHSMEPALRDGGEVLARRTRRFETGRVAVVLAPDPVLGWAETRRTGSRDALWLKRIAAGPGEPMPDSGDPVPAGHYFLLSDNPIGADSRRHGPCPAAAMVGVVIREF
ncbi:S24/S26 family peptidase [Glycomyces paridis]|uniref:S26 family signal peptidase n=1 Tax=Glycomyces paridis TaxID=2126555 RepID=A0A4S8P3J9_9ACTN|nr:S26 family signal peptidase [Glycomyces paridis]THV24548.1 S26 family signal peptidase [Glycomyces paridis]